MKFKEAKKILKAAGVNLKSTKDWEGTMKVSDAKAFMIACREVELCQWRLVLQEGKGIYKVSWDKK